MGEEEGPVYAGDGRRGDREVIVCCLGNAEREYAGFDGNMGFFEDASCKAVTIGRKSAGQLNDGLSKSSTQS